MIDMYEIYSKYSITYLVRCLLTNGAGDKTNNMEALFDLSSESPPAYGNTLLSLWPPKTWIDPRNASPTQLETLTKGAR